MSGAGGRPYMAIPGPSVMPDRVLRAMHRAAPNIYAGEVVDMMPDLVSGLKQVARTDGDVAIYIGNGHAAWEASLANLLNPGDQVLVLATGRFGHGWAEIAEGLGAKAQVIDFGRSSPVAMAQLEAALRHDSGQTIKAVLVCHVDTSTSILNDIPAVRATLDAVAHSAVLGVDCIASLACDRFDMDAWGVDLMVAGSQKGLMTPPGLGLVFFNQKAAALRDGVTRVSRYWDWRPRVAPELFYQYFAGTAPTHHLYGLREALAMLSEEGLEAVWARHERMAQAVWAACDAWAMKGPLQMNVTDPAHRSRAVTALSIGAPMGTRLRHWLERKMGVTLGIGLGMETPEDPESTGFFRIGHMGHMNGHATLGVLGAIETGLTALQIPHGSGGVAAAAHVLAQG